MATILLPIEEELPDTTEWGTGPPARFEDEELDLIAFELWHEASWPATEDDELDAAEAVLSHATGA